ncbi:peptidase [Fusibacter sp. 3D3]|nr:peptidase [Fusibacter sp. 3D3]
MMNVSMAAAETETGTETKVKAETEIKVKAENETRQETRQEDLDFLYENLKTYHPNLFANASEENFLSLKRAIESRLETESNVDFVLDLQSLVALVGDSHTNRSISSIADETHFYPMKISWFDGAWVLSTTEKGHEDFLGNQVVAINGFTMDQVLERFSKFMSADTAVKLRRTYGQSSYIEALYRYAGIMDEDASLKLSLLDSEGHEKSLVLNAVDAESLKALSVVSLSDLREKKPFTDSMSKYYASKSLNDNTYYIQYNRCVEDPDLSMTQFCNQVKSDLGNGNYQCILVDLRKNGGGSDGVIYPLLMLLREEMDTKGVKVVTLIGETTFSSAIINAVELQEMGSVLVGEPTSGSVDHFGSVNGFELPNSGIKVQVSSKFIGLSDYFDAAAGMDTVSLIPDVEMPQTLADYLLGVDTCVEQLLTDSTLPQIAEREWVPLTRARFVGMLYKAAGSPKQMVNENTFADLLGFEWYLPAVDWAVNEKITSGTGDHRFSSARVLTWQEVAVFLVRSAKAMDLEPKITRESQLPEVLVLGAWDLESIEMVWKWGLLPENANFNMPPTRLQGNAMVEALLMAQ